MQIKSLRLPRSRYLERGAAELSREAQKRLAWFDYYETHGRNAALTCRHFGVSRQTFYCWKRRYDPQELRTLEDGSHRPRRRRQPTWTHPQAERVRLLRECYPPGQGQAGGAVATRGLGGVGLHGGPDPDLSAAARSAERACAVPREAPMRHRRTSLGAAQTQRLCGEKSRATWCNSTPWICDLPPGVVLKQFTARDMVSRWDVLAVHPRATSSAATLFLDTLQRRLPFPVRALQVDGGSEFAAMFEQACQKRGLRLFVLPPRSPKLNGQVERANRTHTEEFYEVTPARSPSPS